MNKKKYLIIISTIALVVLLSTAALCNMCGLSLLSDKELEENAESDVKTSGSKNSSKDSASKDSSNSQDSAKKENSQSSDSSNNKDNKNQQNIEINDIIIGDLLNGDVQSVDFLLADNSYTCRPNLALQTDGTEKYEWKVSGGSNDNNTYLMQWNTPSKEGWYSVEVKITKNDGSSGYKKVEVEIHPAAIIGDPIMMPTIVDIRVAAVNGNDDGNYYTTFEYDVIPMMDGSTELIDRVDFSVSAGNIISNNNGIMRWQAPPAPQDVTITVHISDSSGNIMDTFDITVKVVHGV